MLVQQRADVLRLIAQHDHALVSGELARAWSGPDGKDLLALEVILASALHDLSWRELDRVPIWNPETGLPHDFTTYPRELRRPHTARGIREVERVHPYAGLLVSLHYRRLGIETPPGPVRPPPTSSQADDPVLHRDSEFLRLFDNLSLYLCLTPPGSGPAGHYDWLVKRERFALPGDSGGLALEWRDGETLAVAPFPFRGRNLELEIPYRELSMSGLTSAEALDAAWPSTRSGRVTLRLIDALT